MELVIARTAPAPALEGRTFKNIRFFTGAVIEGATKVYVEPGDGADDVVAAYKAKGIEVTVGLPKKAAVAVEAPKAGK